MNTPTLRTLFASLLLLPVSALHAAINISDPPVADPFDTKPLLADGSWATMSVGGGGVGGQTPATFDAKVIADADAAAIATELGESGTIPPSTSGIARWNTGVNSGGIKFLQTRPTGVDYLLLKATLVNATAGPLDSVKVTYDYSKATHQAAEDVPGLRAFWSTTGSPGSWAPIPNLSIDPGAAATYAAPLAVSATITLGTPLAVGGTLYIIWADQNSTDNGTDASYHIDNFAASSGVNCSITGTASAPSRSTGVSPSDPSDDSVGFTVNVTGTGNLSASGWVVTAPPSIAGSTGAYNTDTPLTVPVSSFTNGRVQISVADASLAGCTATISVATTSVLGTNTAANLPILSVASVAAPWTVNDATRTSTHTAATQGDRILESEVIDLTGIGAVSLTVDLDAIAGASSGFEAADSFALQLIIDGGTPVNALGSFDRDQNGRLAYVAGPPAFVELPNDMNTTLNYSFNYIIPAAANSVQIRIIGNSNSAAETFVVDNITLSAAPPTLFAIPSGPPTVDNKGTDDPADDEFSGPVNISAIDLGASTGWRSDEVPQRTGLYSTPNPVIFGPYPVSGGAKTIILTDDLNPGITSQPIFISPPVPVITVTAPTAITRQANGPGALDDTITFDVDIAGSKGGPRWTATGATPTSGSFGTVTFTVPAGPGLSSASVAISDVSYPTATQTVVVAFPSAIYILGQKDLGAGISDVYSQLVTPPDNAWVNNGGARTLTMNDGDAAAAGVKTITSEPVNLSGVAGPVNFSAVLETRDTSAGFETADTFIAELILEDGINPATTVNLILPHDADGSLLLEDDELSDGTGTVADPNVRTLSLSAVIPDNITTATLVIRGINDSANEFMIVRDVLFSTGPVITDTDGDGVSNADEQIMGTSPTDPNDVMRLSQNPGNPYQISFPTVSGRFYRVYVSDDANEASHLLVWKDAGLGTFIGDGSPATFTITVVPGEPRRFYRVHVMQTDGPNSDGVWPATWP